jgi:hypothetical protein
MYIDYGQAPRLLRRVACPRTTAHALQLFDPTCADHWLFTVLRPDTFWLGFFVEQIAVRSLLGDKILLALKSLG